MKLVSILIRVLLGILMLPVLTGIFGILVAAILAVLNIAGAVFVLVTPFILLLGIWQFVIKNLK